MLLRAWLARRPDPIARHDRPGQRATAGQGILQWWREEGGEGITFGSDAHDADSIACGLREAAHMGEAHGFGPDACCMHSGHGRTEVEELRVRLRLACPARQEEE